MPRNHSQFQPQAFPLESFASKPKSTRVSCVSFVFAATNGGLKVLDDTTSLCYFAARFIQGQRQSYWTNYPVRLKRDSSHFNFQIRRD